jgi:uncharacterized protein (DUF427 family)
MRQPLEDQAMEVIDRGRTDAPLLVKPVDRRVRVFLGGTAVADSRRVLLVLERAHLPVYYFPRGDVRTDLMERTATHSRCPLKGEASYWTLEVGDRLVPDAVWGYEEPIPEAAAIAGHVAFYWDRVDAWFEEDDEVFVHPRDPYSRIDVLNSSRHVRVVINGETVAETSRPRLLFETGLPTRYYIPRVDVRMDLLRPSDTRTRCPYKGEASYWHVAAGRERAEDIAWRYYPALPEVAKIENLVCFFNERVDLDVDGERLPRPKTHWT